MVSFSSHPNLISSFYISIAVDEFNGSHTGEAIGAKLLEILKKNGIEGKCHVVLSDNAANMIKVRVEG